MSTIDYLRAKLLSGAKPLDLVLYVDDDARTTVDTAVRELQAAHRAVADYEALTPEQRPKRKLADPPAIESLREAVASAEAAVEAAEAAASGETVLVRFAAMDPDAYNAMAAKFFDVSTGTFDRAAINTAAAAESFIGVYSAGGELVDGVGWPDVRKLLNNSDYDVILAHVMGLNRSPKLAPLRPASSGRPATS